MASERFSEGSIEPAYTIDTETLQEELFRLPDNSLTKSAMPSVESSLFELNLKISSGNTNYFEQSPLFPGNSARFMLASLEGHQSQETRVEAQTTGVSGPSELDVQRANLRRLAEQHISKGRDKRRLYDDMSQLETRAHQAGLSDNQIAQTYFHASRILDGSHAQISDDRREKIAQQVVRNAAYPNKIDQGQHGTCNVNVVEVRVNTRNPEAAAKLVADVVTNGYFITDNASTITPTSRSLEADDEARRHPPSNGKRGHASQIFQITAANIHWQRMLVTPDGKRVPRGSIKYEQIPSKRSRWSGDSGERVMDYSVNPPRELTKHHKGPSLSVSSLEYITNQITGQNESGFVIENKIHGGNNSVHITTPNELEDAIEKVKAADQFPAYIRVHTGNRPFSADAGGLASRQRGVWHVLSITDYDSTTKKVTLDNQWGTRSDKTIDLEKLFKSTMEPGTDEWKKKHEFFKSGLSELELNEMLLPFKGF